MPSARKCERERVFKRYATKQGRQSWTCTGCGHHVHPTAGTIFHKSSTSLHLWYFAMYMMASTRCGLSAKQLEREIGVSYRTAWRMLNLIRNELMAQDDEPLSGDVEADETAWGGKPRRGDVLRYAREGETDLSGAGGRWKQAKKSTAFGMVERGGRVRAQVVPNRAAATLQGRVRGARYACLHDLHRRVAVLHRPLGHLHPPQSPPLGGGLRERRRAHPDHRRVLLEPEARSRWHLPLGVEQVAALVPQ
jgi:transposase-like protein